MPQQQSVDQWQLAVSPVTVSGSAEGLGHSAGFVGCTWHGEWSPSSGGCCTSLGVDATDFVHQLERFVAACKLRLATCKLHTFWQECGSFNSAYKSLTFRCRRATSVVELLLKLLLSIAIQRDNAACVSYMGSVGYIGCMYRTWVALGIYPHLNFTSNSKLIYSTNHFLFSLFHALTSLLCLFWPDFRTSISNSFWL